MSEPSSQSTPPRDLRQTRAAEYQRNYCRRKSRVARQHNADISDESSESDLSNPSDSDTSQRTGRSESLIEDQDGGSTDETGSSNHTASSNHNLPPVDSDEEDIEMPDEDEGDGSSSGNAGYRVHFDSSDEDSDINHEVDLGEPEEMDQLEPEQDVDDDLLLSEESDSDGSGDSVDDDKLFNGSPLNLAEFMLAILTFFIRHKLTGQCLGDLLTLVALICPPDNQCIKTLYKFKKYFSMIGRAVVVFHYFCASCENPLQSETDQCEHCEEGHKVNYFLGMPLLDQLQKMFLRPGFFDSLLFRFQRVKKYLNNIEDIFDGQIYRDQVRDGFLNTQNHISFMWYSDGISIYKSSNFSIWPMYLIINELNYKMRTQRQNIILAGIWFGNRKPNPNVFLGPLHSDLERLKTDGHLFQVHGRVDPVLIRAKMLVGVADLQAKGKFMRFKQWNGFFGCLKCMIRGIRHYLAPGKSIHVYPYSENIVMRRNEQIPGFAAQAVRNRRENPEADVYGVKGPSLLYYMLPNLITCMGIDPMHGVFLGVMKLLTNLWFDSAFSDMAYCVRDYIDIVDQRLRNLKPPSNVQKLIHSIKTQLSFWKALDYKLWCLYYSLPVLLGILPEIFWQHHCKLVSAIGILLQESISLEQVDTAEELLHSYVADFQRLYGLRYMSMNVHQLLHLPETVRQLGPLWVPDCFFLEDLNGGLGRLVHGSRHAAMQICSAVSAFLTLPVRLNALDRQHVVRIYCERMLTSGHTRFKIACEINPLLQIVGQFRPCNPIPLVIADALAALNIVIELGRCSYFDKLRKNGVLYVAESYRKNVQKLSTHVVITEGRIPHLCKIKYFVSCTPCDHRCPPRCDRCPPSYFCIVETYERTHWEALNTPNVRLGYLNRVLPTGVVRAFPIEAISVLCFFMNIEGDLYIASPVNTLEVE